MQRSTPQNTAAAIGRASPSSLGRRFRSRRRRTGRARLPAPRSHRVLSRPRRPRRPPDLLQGRHHHDDPRAVRRRPGVRRPRRIPPPGSPEPKCRNALRAGAGRALSTLGCAGAVGGCWASFKKQDCLVTYPDRIWCGRSIPTGSIDLPRCARHRVDRHAVVRDPQAGTALSAWVDALRRSYLTVCLARRRALL
jgi:hypothetical protein